MRFLENSKNGSLLWEIPKGKKEFMESDLDAAIREFEEETRIPITSYKLLRHNHPIKYTRSYNGVTYNFYYYVAHYMDDTDTKDPCILFDYNKQLAEISDIKWIDTVKLNFVCDGNDEAGHTKDVFHKAITIHKKHFPYGKIHKINV